MNNSASPPETLALRRMGNRLSRSTPIAMLLAILGSTLLTHEQAQAEPLYASVSLGGNVTGDVTMRSRSNDRASICDEYINPRALSVPGCTAPDRGVGDGWAAPFDGGRGFSAEAELGYRFSPRFRVAIVYGYHTTQFDQTVSSTDASGVDFNKIGNELSTGEESLGLRVRTNCSPSHIVTGRSAADGRPSQAWEWASPRRARTSPGSGPRSANPEDILTGRDQPNAAEIRSNLAGTVSAGRSPLKDTTAGFLVLAGASRPLTDTVSVAFKVQWKRFATFESGAYGGGMLRSHPPNLRLDGSEPVSTWSRTGDTDRYSILLTMRFAMP